MITVPVSDRHEGSDGAKQWLEVEMPTTRNEARGGKAFAFPLFGIFFLLTCYWVLAEWQKVPALISNALTAVHWAT